GIIADSPRLAHWRLVQPRCRSIPTRGAATLPIAPRCPTLGCRCTSTTSRRARWSDSPALALNMAARQPARCCLGYYPHWIFPRRTDDDDLRASRPTRALLRRRVARGANRCGYGDRGSGDRREPRLRERRLR